MFLLWILVLIPLVHCEIFNSLTDREPYYKELDDQWQFIAKFPYSEKGTVRVRVQFKSDADCLLTDIDENNDISCPMLHWYSTSMDKWKRKLSVNSSCRTRVADSIGVEHIQLKIDQTINDTECAIRGDYMICELTRVVADKWGFLAASYCDHTLTERDFNWQVTSTNGAKFSNKHPPATERHFFTVNIVLAIIATLLVVFWLIYPNPVKLNRTLLLVYKVSLWCCAIALWLFLGSNSALNSSGKRNFSLNITASVISFISLAMLAHVTVVVAFSGSLMTVQLSRIKMVFSYLISLLYFALNIGMLIYEVMVWDERTRVYFLDKDSVYLWVVVGLHVVLWIHNTVFTILKMVSPSTENRNYYKVFYIFFSCIILSVPVIAVCAVLNLSDYSQYLLVVAWCTTAHVVCYLFLFLLIKDNHTLASVYAWFKATFCSCWAQICCCMPFCGKGTGPDGVELPFCLRCCPCIPLCCPCFMCSACCQIKGGKRYGSESDLRDSLVDTLKKEKERKPSGFELNLVDVESSDTVIENTPVIADTPIDRPKPVQPLPVARRSTSSDDKTKISVTTAERQASNVKVIPWLDQTSPAYKGLSEHGYSNRVEPRNDGSLKPKPPLYRFNSENYLGSKARPGEGRPAAQFVVKSYDGSESVRSDIGKQGNRSLDWDTTEGPRWSKRGWSHTGPTGPMLESSSEDPVMFDTASYNNDKIRDEKAVKTTMRYRRNSLKQTLSKVPSHVLLERVRQAHASTEGGLPALGKVHVIKSPRPAPPERSKSKLWRMLSNRYDGNRLATKEDKLRTTVKVFTGGKDRWK